MTDLGTAQSLNDIVKLRRTMSAQERHEHYNRRAPYDAPEVGAARHQQWVAWCQRLEGLRNPNLEVDYADIDDGMTIDEGFAALAKIVEERRAAP